ncbi:flagellar hook-length control protein FliK [Calidifontibacillus erzurumensis]|uniref:Flagellar hook-length control protein FliK n=1 Tax=Calidifontibacillus erzurumensis TaxID=2741433 RepID=A0A8J8GG41_9BACI|nr:flagellar hook-length control protein FliK [Calidifontibacillus erzurumensis]NSL51181.1 flagellar hook-length control protein FliK [Calidifontibacillus erzurumensis]
MNAQGLGLISCNIRSLVENQLNYETANQKANNFSFFDLLNIEMSPTDQSSIFSTTTADDENNSFLNEELLEVFQQFLETMQADEQVIDPAIIEHPDWNELLMGLPQNFVQQFTNDIHSAKSIEQMLAHTQSGSKEQFIVILAVLYQMKEKKLLSERELQALQDVMNKQLKETAQLNSLSITNMQPLFAKKMNRFDKEKMNGIYREQSNVSGKLNVNRLEQHVRYSNSRTTGETGIKNTSKNNLSSFIIKSDSVAEKSKIDGFEKLIVSSIKESTPIRSFQQLMLISQQNHISSSEEQILHQLQQIIKNSKFSTLPNGQSQMQVKLSPEHLGMLTIKLSETNGEMVAKIIASTVHAKEAIEKNLQVLRQAFAAQNIQTEKIEVLYQGESQFDGTSKDYKEQHGERKKQQDEKAAKGYLEDDQSESQSFIDELLNVIV